MSGPDLDDDWADEWDDADSNAYQDRVELRELILSSLAATAAGLRAGPGFCAGCRPGALCADHRADPARALEYEGAYMRVRGIGSDGAMLELIGGLRL